MFFAETYLFMFYAETYLFVSLTELLQKGSLASDTDAITKHRN